MELEARLRAFAALARRGSFSGAADELYVSQPAVSKHIAALEAEVGRPLVSRGRAGSSLTPAGELLADYVLRAEALLANARRALSAGEEAETGTLALAASGIPGTYLLPDVLLEFHERYPGVELEFDVSTSADALTAVRTHRVELAVLRRARAPGRARQRAAPRRRGGARRRTLARRPAAPAEGHREPHVAFARRGIATRAAVETDRWEMGLHAVRSVELPSWEAVKRAVARGGGIAAGQPSRAGSRARAGCTRRPRCPEVASDPDDCARVGSGRPAHAARRALRRAAARAAHADQA